MRYKIGDLARLFNLSTESIRHYERQGLIHPQKAEGSSYRYYQAWDMAVLSACRQYRALGFTLEESAEMLGQHNPGDVLDELRGREEAIEKEIARQCQMLRTVRAWRREAEAACALMGRFELETNAATRFLPYQYGDELTRDEAHLSCVREWLGHIPYVYVGMLVPLAAGACMDAPVTVGLGMAEVGADVLKPASHESVVMIPSRLCLHTAFHFESGAFDWDEWARSLFAQLDQRGLQADGNAFCRFNVISWTDRGMSAAVDCFVPGDLKILIFFYLSLDSQTD